MHTIFRDSITLFINNNYNNNHNNNSCMNWGGNLPRLWLRSLAPLVVGTWKDEEYKHIKYYNIKQSTPPKFLVPPFHTLLPSYERGIGAVGYLGIRRDEQDALFHHQAHINSAELYTVIASIPRASAQIAAQMRHTQPILSPPDKVKL